jgi:hypothetical protein
MVQLSWPPSYADLFGVGGLLARMDGQHALFPFEDPSALRKEVARHGVFSAESVRTTFVAATTSEYVRPVR